MKGDEEVKERLDGRFAALRIQGKRPYQEDDHGLIELGDDDRSEVLLLADGMGGHVSGDTASRTIVRTFAEIYPCTEGPIPERLDSCLNAANDALAAAIAENPGLSGMGSTVVAAVISRHGLNWISVGDSPLWLFREGKLCRLNADHSMAPVLADLVAVGRMTEEEAATDSQRHALRSAVMGDEIHLVDDASQPESSQPVEVHPSDRVLLASDGLMTLADEEIADILRERQEAPLAEVVKALIQAVEAVGHPHQDNTTILLYKPAADSGPETAPAEPATADATAQAEPKPHEATEPPTSASASTEHTPQAEPELREATASPSRKRGSLGIALLGSLLFGFGLLGGWFLWGMQDEYMSVEPALEPHEPAEQGGDDPCETVPMPYALEPHEPAEQGGDDPCVPVTMPYALEPHEPAEQGGRQSPPSAFAPKDGPPSVQPDSGQASGEGDRGAGTTGTAQPPGLQAAPVLISPSAQPDTGQTSEEEPQEKAVKEDTLPKPSAPSDTTAQ